MANIYRVATGDDDVGDELEQLRGIGQIEEMFELNASCIVAVLCLLPRWVLLLLLLLLLARDCSS